MQIASQVVLAHLSPKMDEWSERHGLSGVVLGTGKGGQTRDVTFFVTQVLEKARDNFNKGALAVADIRKCHDELPWAAAFQAAFQGALRRGISKDDACAFLRLHRMPRILFEVDGRSTRILQRTRGALTGSSSASAMARIIIEDSLTLARPSFSNSFNLFGQVFDAMSWSDNLVCTGMCISSASSNMKAWQSVLCDVMNMDLKPDSFVLVPARTRQAGGSCVVLDGCSWEVVDGCRCLGAWVSGTGKDRSERTFLANCWSRMFWANCRVLTNRVASVSSRLRFWKSLVYGVSDHRFVGIRPCKSNLDALEASSNKLLRSIVGARPSSDDSPETFCIRRNKLISTLKEECSFGIRKRFCYKIVTWVEHLWRHKESHLYKLLYIHDDCWLRTMRVLVNPSCAHGFYESGATRTRSGPGAPLRWGAGWLERLSAGGGGWENPSKCKRSSWDKANALYAMIFDGSSSRIARSEP